MIFDCIKQNILNSYTNIQHRNKYEYKWCWNRLMFIIRQRSSRIDKLYEMINRVCKFNYTTPYDSYLFENGTQKDIYIYIYSLKYIYIEYILDSWHHIGISLFDNAVIYSDKNKAVNGFYTIHYIYIFIGNIFH